jgi:hypothetical protein
MFRFQMIKKMKFLSEQHNRKFLDELWGLGTVISCKLQLKLGF